MPKTRGRRKRDNHVTDDIEIHGSDEADAVQEDKEEQEALSDEEVYGLCDSDDLGDDDGFESDGDEAEEDDGDDFDMGSDIEEEEKVHDDRAWGKSNRRFYSTDYVDQDYEGFYEGKEAEEAEQEEQEAKLIQKKLIQDLDDADFDIGITTVKPDEQKEALEQIERDVSKLSKRQKLDLLHKESPEFLIMIQDFKDKIKELQRLIPILNSLEKERSNPAVKYLNKKSLIITNYCTNLSFYLLLKARRVPVQNHPVLKSLYKYRKLMEEFCKIDNIINPEIEKLQKGLDSEKPLSPDITLSSSKKNEKNILKLLSKSKQNKKSNSNDKYKENPEYVENPQQTDTNNKEAEFNDDEDNIESITKEAEGKRAITYEMAKNKGLMPKRNKDQRNPRVKHRKKYRKALIRRRGQVRTARNEIPVYGGELSGIRVGVTKSIKFK